MERFFFTIGKADVLQLDGVVLWPGGGSSGAVQILLLQNVRHLADDGTQLGQIVRIGIGGDQGLHDAEGEHNHRNQLVRRQAAIHRQQTADGQDAHQCGGKNGHAS